jgi:hypothetical protein
MRAEEASVVVPLSLEETWDFIFNDPRRAVQFLPDVVAVEDFEMREYGTPRYRMVRKADPFTTSFVSDYFVFERPYRTVSRRGYSSHQLFDLVPLPFLSQSQSTPLPSAKRHEGEVFLSRGEPSLR